MHAMNEKRIMSVESRKRSVSVKDSLSMNA